MDRKEGAIVVPEASDWQEHSNGRRVLLVTSAAPAQSPFSTREKRPPLGIGFLISVLRDAGHKVSFIDNYLQPSDFLETGYLQKNAIDFAGIYANTICFRDTLRMLHAMQRLRQTGQWRGKIIVGGPHAAVAPQTIPDFVDFIVQGEGEYAIRDIVAGKVADRIVRYPRINDLDTLPMPAWDCFVDLPYEWGMKLIGDGRVFTMNTSRGCPFRCAFCSVNSVWGRKYTSFSAERIVSDIEHLVNTYGAKGVYFREDNFTLNEGRLRKFCDLLLRKNLGVSWVCETRVSTLSEELVQLMARAGAKGFYFGVESGSQRMLELMRKDITTDQIRDAFRWCRDAGIKAIASTIIGVPGETESDLCQTNKLLEEIKPTLVWHNVYTGIPYSDLYHTTIKDRLYEYIDDRGIIYLQGHNDRVSHYYQDQWNACIPDREENKDWTNKPKISVLMAVHNGERFLPQALESIYHQTCQDFEFVIVDDGSTDGTPDILLAMKDSRTVIYRNAQKQGLTKSLNTGLKLCRGKYIARMDADDVSLPQRFERQLEVLEKNAQCLVVGCWCAKIDSEGKVRGQWRLPTEPEDIKAELAAKNRMVHGTTMMRRAALVEAGGYDERFEYAQDYDLWLRLSETGELRNIGECLYALRRWEGAITNTKRQMQDQYAEYARTESQRRRTAQPQACTSEIAAAHLRKAQPAFQIQSPQASEPTSERADAPPLVSVIVPTYNRPEELARAITSILSQTYPNMEIVVVNDAGAYAEETVRRCNTRGNIAYIRHATNRGLAAARNSGIRAARGKYIAYLDDDDIYYPDHIEQLVTALQATAYKVAHSEAHRSHQEMRNGQYIETGRTIPYATDVTHEELLVRNLLPVLCIMHEKACLDDVGYFDETLPTHEDWDLWIRMSRRYPFLHIARVTAQVTWRTDGSTMTSARRKEFCTIPQVIYNKYRDSVVDKPQVAARQAERLESLRKRYLANAGDDRINSGPAVDSHFPERDACVVRQGNEPCKATATPPESQCRNALRVAIKICTPSRDKPLWGDTWFAQGLAKAIVKDGHHCELHFRDEWDQPDRGIDVAIHIKGKFSYTPKPHCLNILWIISHPELCSIDEINRFDAVFCASRKYIEQIRGQVGVPCFYLPQATDDELFRPCSPRPVKDIDVLFVGTNYCGAKGRGIIRDVLASGKDYNLRIIGRFWQGLIDPKYLKAEYVQPEKLPELYGRAKVVLNDHHETMKASGFINNRTYDVAGSGSFQISDDVEGIGELGVVTYRDAADLARKLDFYLAHDDERERIAAVVHQRCRDFTFTRAAQTILSTIPDLREAAKAAHRSSRVPEPRVLGRADQAAENRPKISVVLACYNSERFLPQCIESILNQTMAEWELFLPDDGSTDGTRRIIEDYARRDPRIRAICFDDNKGPYIRRNYAIERAAADFIVIQDADDIMCPDKLERLYRAITEDDRVGVVGSFYRLFLDEHQDPNHGEEATLATTHERILQEYREQGICDFCWHGSAILRKKLFEDIGLYDENPFGSDSFWLLKALEYACRTDAVRFKNIPEFLTLRRMHLDSQTEKLPTFDPRSPRAKFCEYRRSQIQKLRERLDANPNADICAELRGSMCNDFVARHGHLFQQWAGEPLTSRIAEGFIARIFSQFAKGQFVRCIETCGIVERLVEGVARSVRCYDLVRGLAYFALALPERSRQCLRREFETHGTQAARDFCKEYLERQDASWTRTRRHEIVRDTAFLRFVESLYPPQGRTMEEHHGQCRDDARFSEGLFLALAAEWGEKALAYKPDLVKAHYFVGASYARLGKPDLSCRHLEAVLDSLEGQLAFGRLDRNSSEFRDDTNLGDCYVASCTLLAQCYGQQNRYEDVHRIYSRLLGNPHVKLPQDQKRKIQNVQERLNRIRSSPLARGSPYRDKINNRVTLQAGEPIRKACSGPKVTVVTACHNGEKHLPECIESVRGQTLQEWELFLLDDGSTDGTRQIIDRYARSDPRIRACHFEDNRGPYVRRNFAISQAASDFIVIQDADDIMSPAKLDTLYREITDNPRLAMVGSCYRTFLDPWRGPEYTECNDLPLAQEEIVERFASWRHAMSHGSAMIRKTLFDEIGPYDENPFASDSFWSAKLGEYIRHTARWKVKTVAQHLTFIRMHVMSQTHQLSTFDPRNRRARYRQYCECKLATIRERMQAEPERDIARELRECDCSDFLTRFKAQIVMWEDEPLDSRLIPQLLESAVWLFNHSYHIGCITMLNGVEAMDRGLARRMRNFDLLRAMSLYALDMKDQSLAHLHREMENHDSAAAREFLQDYFERGVKTDVRQWCADHGDRFDLQMIEAQAAITDMAVTLKS